MRKNIFLQLTLSMIVVISMFLSTTCRAQKREFRGAWIQCVNGQYLNKSMKDIRDMLSNQLDVLQMAGINAIMFQVRAEADALYSSSYEPWSRYLTGKQGVAPSDGWDPLKWMVEECHKRNMECHAWINPYRAKTKGTVELAKNHPTKKYPNRFFEYGGMLIFDPSMEINRIYTCMIIEDILKKYDVDGLHMDDYFYPYPVEGETIPDRATYDAQHKKGETIDDWRRDNVNKLIEDIHNLIHKTKPWVKFGVSPFGIYRNDPSGKNTETGSATNGLQNYSQLYADILLWTKKGWVDYNIPQIYWNFGTKAADYGILCNWWNDYCNNRPLYIGQDVERTVRGSDLNNPDKHQMDAKYELMRSLKNVQGSCQWYAAAVVSNEGGYLDKLMKEYHKYPALQPKMEWIDNSAPKKIKKLKLKVYKNGAISLVWKAPKGKKEMDKVVKYAIYSYDALDKIDVQSDDAAKHLVDFTTDTEYVLMGNQIGKTFVITALDRMQNESEAVKIRL